MQILNLLQGRCESVYKFVKIVPWESSIKLKCSSSVALDFGDAGFDEVSLLELVYFILQPIRELFALNWIAVLGILSQGFPE